MPLNLQKIRNRVDHLRALLDSVPQTLLGITIIKIPVIGSTFEVVDEAIDVLDELLDDLGAPAAQAEQLVDHLKALVPLVTRPWNQSAKNPTAPPDASLKVATAQVRAALTKANPKVTVPVDLSSPDLAQGLVVPQTAKAATAAVQKATAALAPTEPAPTEPAPEAA